MMTLDGRYPPNFRLPLRLQELLEYGSTQLDRILLAYDLNVRGRSRLSLGRRGSHGLLDHDDLDFGSSSTSKSTMKAVKLVALFEFLGAHRLVAYMERSMLGSGGRGLRTSQRMLLDG